MTYTYTDYTAIGGDGTWNRKRLITIPRTAISGNQTNIPLLYKIKEIGTQSLSNGADIVFVDSTEKYRLHHDLVSYKNYSGSVYIRISSMVDQNGQSNAAQFYMYYDNSAGGNQLNLAGYNPSSAWEKNNYIFVSHMHDSGSNTQKVRENSRYHHNLWKGRSASPSTGNPDMVTSFMGSAQMWDDEGGDVGSAAYISSNSTSGFSNIKGKLTVEAIISGGGGCGGADIYGRIVTLHNRPTDNNFHAFLMQTRSNLKNGFYISAQNHIYYGSDWTSSWWPKKGNIANTTILVGSFLSGGATVGSRKMLTDGQILSEIEVEDSVLVDSKGDGIYIGQLPGSTGYSFSGALLGLRVLNDIKNNGWHKTSYLNISSIACNKISQFYTIGAEQGGDSMVTDLTIEGITVPATGGTPDTTIDASAQYTADSIAWTGNPTTFADSTVYEVVITLNASTGYTFNGVAANSFSVPGQSSESNSAGSGDSMVVTVSFPPTQTTTSIGNWYDTAWDYRKKININKACIYSSQNNFPILYRISGIGRNSLANGTDIIFVGSGTSSTPGNRLSHDLVSFSDYSGNAWVKVSSLSHQQDKILYMYYGNLAGGNQLEVSGYKPSSTWDNTYCFVCHMKDSSSATNTRLVDSSRFKIPLWKSATSNPSMRKTFLGSGQFWDGGDVYISSNANASLTGFTNTISLEVIISGTGVADEWGTALGFHNKPTDAHYHHTATLFFDDDTDWGYAVSCNNWTYDSPNNAQTFTWPKYGSQSKTVAATLTFSSNTDINNKRLYSEGKDVAIAMGDTTRTISNVNQGVMIGASFDVDLGDIYHFSGTIMEARISNVYRQLSWNKIQSFNISALSNKKNSVFYSITASEEAPEQTSSGKSAFDTVSGCIGVDSVKDWKWGKILYGTSYGFRSKRADGAALDWSCGRVIGEAGYYVPSGSPLGWKWCPEYAGTG